MKPIKETKSISPECKKKIPATVEELDKVYMTKECPKHGQYELSRRAWL